jgi:hypothetical protein|nr:MAG TPA: hypothetical protein [Caudoviricetes sp.]
MFFLFSTAHYLVYISKKYWVGIRFNEDMPDDKIKAYVKQSYDLVASSQKNKLVK